MRPRLLLGVAVVGAVAVTPPWPWSPARRRPAGPAAGPARGLRRRLPEREAELRAALLPDDDAVAAARAEVARRRGRHAADEESDDLPYSFY